LDAALRSAVEVSFNSISVDGDTSTNDTVLILANGAAGAPDLRGLRDLEGLAAFTSALTSLCTDLAQQIVRDGEGATKFITVQVAGAASDADARRAAKAIANSPLVKTAFYGGDANWGRILCAVGYSGAEVDPARADLWIGVGAGLAPALGDHAGGDRKGAPLQLVAHGQPLAYPEAVAGAIFAEKEITVTVNLGLAAGRATVWTCDLSHDYVSINGHYRT
jgi:glutamate N-acetyltransferase/amino-acid N-acetyltransferase